MDGTQPPPNPDESNALPGLVGVSFLLAITMSIYGIRIYSRMHPTFKLNASDYLVSAALLLELGVLACLVTAIGFGYGHYDYYISADTLVKIQKCFFVLGLFGFWASSLARISIGTMLLHFEISKTRRVIVWALICLQVAMPIGANIFTLLQCRPIRSLWEPVPDAKCWGTKVSQSYSYLYSAMGIFSDLTFAAMPILFIWSLHRPLMERILLTVLMALGIIAAVASAMKVYFQQVWDPRKNTFRDWMPLFWWFRVEELGLIAAACAPFIKPTIDRIIAGFGASQFRFLTLQLKSIRSGGDAVDDAPKLDSVVGVMPDDPDMKKQPAGQAVNVAPSGNFNRPSDTTNFPNRQGSAEV